MPDLNAPKHHLVVKPQQGTLVLNDDSQQQNYEQRLMNKQQEIVKKRMKYVDDNSIQNVSSH